MLDKALSCFILEARKKDGQFYPDATVKNILSALFRVYKHNVGANNVESSSRERYYPTLHNSLDSHLRMLCSNGIGLEVKKAAVVKAEDEAQLWTSGIIGLNCPKTLLNAVFF